MSEFFKPFSRAFRAPFIWLIRFYQKTVSPDHGIFRRIFPYGFCKYSPSCSQYMKLAIEKYGVFLGVFKGLWRILRCNPFSRGGEDMP